MNAHAAFLLLIIALAVLLFCRPREQEMRIEARLAADTACDTPMPTNPCLYIDCDRPDTKEYV